MPIVIVPRNGPPDATSCPMMLCDACGECILTDASPKDPAAPKVTDRPGIGVSWARYTGERDDGPAHERLESSPMFFVHKGQCDRKFQAYGEQFFRTEDHWSNRWQDIDIMFKQLIYNMAHPFENDSELAGGKVLYYPPARIINLLPTDGFVVKPNWLIGNVGS